jgi:hypothetical protein
LIKVGVLDDAIVISFEDGKHVLGFTTASALELANLIYRVAKNKIEMEGTNPTSVN